MSVGCNYQNVKTVMEKVDNVQEQMTNEQRDENCKKERQKLKNNNRNQNHFCQQTTQLMKESMNLEISQNKSPKLKHKEEKRME